MVLVFDSVADFAGSFMTMDAVKLNIRMAAECDRAPNVLIKERLLRLHEMSER